MSETPAIAIETARYRDGHPFALDIVRESLAGIGLPSYRESWRIYARTEQEAHATVEYHFGRSALWYRIAPPPVGQSR